VSCAVSPGFDFQDFELASRDSLLKSYPEHEALIVRMTRG
jgi:predicted cupin superfamily sugar epimerase